MLFTSLLLFVGDAAHAAGDHGHSDHVEHLSPDHIVNEIAKVNEIAIMSETGIVNEIVLRTRQLL